MTIDIAPRLDRPLPIPPLDELDPAMADDIAKFRRLLGQYLAGELSDDEFKVFRLTNGVYGQRQGGTNQMIRVRMPYGTITADQLDRLAYVADHYSRGWGHITTRQNLQFHFIELTELPDVMALLAEVGLTTREACGDTIRNVQGCHLAGACPYEVIDISAWAQATNDYFLRNPLGQRLPRKFKINFSGCETDCGQAMFNDVGVIAASRQSDAGTIEAGFRVFVAGGLGANPHAALAIEPFTAREDLIPTIEAVVRTFEQTGNRDNKLRARMKWVVETLGWEETQRRILRNRSTLLASATWPHGIPDAVRTLGDAPAGLGGATPSAIGQGTPVALGGGDARARWEHANVVRGVANGTVSAYAWCELGDLTSTQLRGLAAIQRHFRVELRATNRQNMIIRGLRDNQLPALHERLDALGMATPGAELSRDVVSCPGADTCSLAITQSRGLAKAIGERLESDGLAEVGGVRMNISGCTNSCGQHHVADIGFYGVERRAHGRSVPGYQMLLGGHVGDARAEFGARALRLPAKAAPEATARVMGRFARERGASERFSDWLARSGGAAAVAADLTDLGVVPDPDEAPDHYVDFDEYDPFAPTVGASECAT
ncbi:MAG: nitrite/sulfite reductase [Actinomycetota bacterium]